MQICYCAGRNYFLHCFHMDIMLYRLVAMETDLQTCHEDKKIKLVALEPKVLQTVTIGLERRAEQLESGHIAVLLPWRLQH